MWKKSSKKSQWRCFPSLFRADRARWIVALREHKETDVSTNTAGEFMCFVYKGSGL